LELDQAAIKQARKHCVRIYQADLDSDDWPTLIGSAERFDVVLAADVLEHLRNPTSVLRKMAKMMGDRGSIVLSLPHVGHSAIHACLYRGDFQYRDWGLLDRTHLRFFGLRNMQALVETCELKIVDAELVRIPPHRTEFARAWRRLPPALRRELRKSPYGDVYQVVLRAVRQDDTGNAVMLCELGHSDTSGSASPLRRSLTAWLHNWRG
jgi:hypothetical protein